MDRTPNWKQLDLTGKCGACIYYAPRHKNGKLKAHGRCDLGGQYKQRTETCKKYDSGVTKL